MRNWLNQTPVIYRRDLRGTPLRACSSLPPAVLVCTSKVRACDRLRLSAAKLRLDLLDFIAQVGQNVIQSRQASDSQPYSIPFT